MASMSLTKRRRAAILASAGGLILAAGTLLAAVKSDAIGAAEPAKVRAEARTAWLADWQWEAGAADLKAAGELQSLQVFAAYFDESDRLVFTPEFREGLPAIRDAAALNGTKHLDLTLVNDILYADGSESQKDAALVSRLVASDQSRTKHLKDVLAAVEMYGFDGVELDYEKVKDADWNKVIRFIADLQVHLKNRGKTLRVVLETRAPTDKVKLPAGPTYVMMAYNLYGGHSGPGPKADEAYVKQVAKRLAKLPGDPYVALAAGGFDWGPSGDVKGVTEQQAALLAERSMKPPTRDAASGSLRFDYLDDGGAKHTVWYADGETLSRWIAAAKSAGRGNIALWRLGELGDGTLAMYGVHGKGN
ncbi:glycosyl hydrolase family 18 protein [Cohnella sp. REN36]|uniref:glycosyl hydrolase family 18 protein n=1 Tax=Cohnella sp. REN36 TaxID=2887347 RepID=UPI001D15CFC8|nr:glycosyl hydrolase family 18 protein [Cohnella sp. REN36]MCC3374717.1 glycosyl hydrolase [Cohnella sp. REN36]